MNRSPDRSWSVAFLLCLCSSSVAAQHSLPAAVSPGSGDAVASITHRCPTFSWSPALTAQAHEVLVFEIDSLLPTTDPAQRPVLHHRVAGAASSWTPPLASCLEGGASYGWSVRAHTADGAGEWSDAMLFQVTSPEISELSEALAVIQRHLAARDEVGGRAVTGSLSLGTVSETAPRRAAKVPQPLTSAGSSSLQIDGFNTLTTEGLVPVRCIIATSGVYWPGGGGSPCDDTCLGEVRWIAGQIDEAPSGWELCEGQSLSVLANPALFQILGTTYGGNGTTTFLLPDLRGRLTVHP